MSAVTPSGGTVGWPLYAYADGTQAQNPPLVRGGTGQFSPFFSGTVAAPGYQQPLPSTTPTTVPVVVNVPVPHGIPFPIENSRVQWGGLNPSSTSVSPAPPRPSEQMASSQQQDMTSFAKPQLQPLSVATRHALLMRNVANPLKAVSPERNALLSVQLHDSCCQQQVPPRPTAVSAAPIDVESVFSHFSSSVQQVVTEYSSLPPSPGPPIDKGKVDDDDDHFMQDDKDDSVTDSEVLMDEQKPQMGCPLLVVESESGNLCSAVESPLPGEPESKRARLVVDDVRFHPQNSDIVYPDSFAQDDASDVYPGQVPEKKKEKEKETKKIIEKHKIDEKYIEKRIEEKRKRKKERISIMKLLPSDSGEATKSPSPAPIPDEKEQSGVSHPVSFFLDLLEKINSAQSGHPSDVSSSSMATTTEKEKAVTTASVTTPAFHQQLLEPKTQPTTAEEATTTKVKEECYYDHSPLSDSLILLKDDDDDGQKPGSSINVDDSKNNNGMLDDDDDEPLFTDEEDEEDDDDVIEIPKSEMEELQKQKLQQQQQQQQGPKEPNT